MFITFQLTIPDSLESRDPVTIIRVIQMGAIILVICDIHVNDLRLRCNVSRVCEN